MHGIVTALFECRTAWWAVEVLPGILWHAHWELGPRKTQSCPYCMFLYCAATIECQLWPGSSWTVSEERGNMEWGLLYGRHDYMRLDTSRLRTETHGDPHGSPRLPPQTMPDKVYHTPESRMYVHTMWQVLWTIPCAKVRRQERITNAVLCLRIITQCAYPCYFFIVAALR